MPVALSVHGITHLKSACHADPFTRHGKPMAIVRRKSGNLKLAIAEVLEPRVLYSADALGPFAALLIDEDDNRSRIRESMDIAAQIPDASASLETQASSLWSDARVNLFSPDTDAQQSSLRAEIAFVDSAVDDYQTLAAVLRESGVIVVTIDANEDGLQLIGQTLQQFSDVKAVHLIGHGEPGSMHLGQTRLDGQMLEAQASAVTLWNQALHDEADILLYGCNLASDVAGKDLIARMATLTGADVAGSDDLTANKWLGGDWSLEVSSGKIEAELLGTGSRALDWNHSLASIVVDRFDDVFDIADTTTMEELLLMQSQDGHQVSLREAIVAANNSTAQADRIELRAGTYVLTLDSGFPEEISHTGDLDISDDLQIIGAGQDDTYISQSADDRVLDIRAGSVAISGLTVEGGDNNGIGAGANIQLGAKLSLDDVAVSGNQATDHGGGIFNLGQLEIRDSTISNNESANAGGGIYNLGTLLVERSLIEENLARTGSGGGIETLGDASMILDEVIFQSNEAATVGGGLSYIGKDAQLNKVTFVENTALNGGGARIDGEGATLERVTFSENTANAAGGGLLVRGLITINNSTFYGNTDETIAGGLYMETGIADIQNSIFDQNSSNQIGGRDTNVSGLVSSQGFNLFSNTEGINFIGPPVTTDIVTPDAQLASLAQGSGFVSTHALLPGSPAINAGVSTGSIEDASGVPVDEIPDIGAHESQDASSLVFWTDELGNIWRADTELSNPQIIFSGRGTGIDAPSDIEVDLSSSRLYWMENQGSRIFSASIDGSGAVITEQILAVTATSFALDRNNNRLYAIHDRPIDPIVWFNIGTPENSPPDGVIQRVPANSNDIEIDVVNQRLFWSEGGNGGANGNIVQATLVPEGISDIVVHQNPAIINPSSLAIDPINRTLYFTDPSANAVFSLDYDTGALSSELIQGAKGIDFNSDTNTLLVSSESTTSFFTLDTNLDVIETSVNNASGNALSLATASTQGTPAPVDEPPIVRTTVLGVNEAGTVDIDTTSLSASDLISSDDQLIFSVTSLPSQGVLLVGGIDLANLPVEQRIFSQAQLALGSEVQYQHDGNDSGMDDLIGLRLTDGINQIDVPNLELSVTATDDAPTVVANLQLQVNEREVQAISTDLLQHSDVDTDASLLRYTIAPGDEPAKGVIEHRLDAAQAGDQRFSFTQQEVDDGQIFYVHSGLNNGVDQFAYTLSDSNTSISAQFSINILEVQDQPTLQLLDQSIAESETLTFDNIMILASDDDGDQDLNDEDLPSALRYSITGAQHGTITVNGEANRVFTHAELVAGDVVYRNDNGLPATENFNVEVIDSGDLTQNGALTLAIEAVNDVPVQVANTPLSLEERAEVQISGLELQYTDEESDPAGLIYTIPVDQQPGKGVLVLRESAGSVDLPVSSFTQAQVNAGQIWYVHQGFDVGQDSFGFELSDSEATQVGQVELQINNVNDAPENLQLDTAGVRENESNGVLVGQLSAVERDVGDTVTWSVVNDPRFTVVGNELFLIDGSSLDHEAFASVSVDVIATDTNGASAQETFVIPILDVNEAPVLLASPNMEGLSEGSPLSFAADTFVDVDGDAVSYQAVQANGDALPDWLSFRPDTREFVLLDPSMASETLSVRLIASDGRGQSADVVLNLSIALPPVEPEPVEPEPVEPEPVEPPDPAGLVGTVSSPVDPLPVDPELALTEPEMPAAALPDTPQNQVPLPVIEIPAIESVQASPATQLAPASEIKSSIVTESSEESTSFNRLINTDSIDAELFDFEEVDLQELLSFDGFSRVDSILADAIVAPLNSVADRISDTQSVDDIDLNTLLSMATPRLLNGLDSLTSALDEEQKSIDDQKDLALAVVGTTAGVTTGLSVGYLIWLIRGGTLMGSMLSSLPAWRFVDPLPVLSSLADVDEQDVDSESLESIVESSASPASSTPAEQSPGSADRY